ncbi:MAG: hypothetical protein AB1791_12580 [Chloroflexota bacterium]
MVSFVLRFVREATEDQQVRWRGVIKHVQGNSESQFTQFAEALEFMQARVNELVQTTMAQTTENQAENPFVETARLWGEFMPRYTRLMMDTMTGVMGVAGRPSPMQKQVEEALAATLSLWGVPTQQDQVRAAAQLESLTGQLAELSDKMERLEKRMADLKRK